MQNPPLARGVLLFKGLGQDPACYQSSPTLVLAGGESEAWMLNGMQALAAALPDATYLALHGQTHNLRPKAVAPELMRFFAGAIPASGAGEDVPTHPPVLGHSERSS
jgi:hypothetical protein